MQSLAGFYGLSLLDALNPSALAVTLFLLLRGGPFGKRVVTYVSAIFATYLALGLLIFAGLGSVLALMDTETIERVGYGAAAVGGAVMLLYALFPPKSAREGLRAPKLPEKLPLTVVFMTGVTITIAEFSTAVPYLGAIGILRGFTTNIALAALLLITYNMIFVLPPLLLLFAYSRFTDSVQPRMQRWLEKRQNKKDTTWLWILGIVGFFLARMGVTYYMELWGYADAGAN